MYKLVVQAAAVKMSQDAYDWYNEQQPNLGDLFLFELERCFDKLENNPLYYAPSKKNFRQIRFKTFPYVIVYEIIGNDVVIFSVFHTSKNPRKKYIR